MAAGGGDAQRVAVGCGLGHDLAADRAAGAHLVVDHHRHTQRIAQALHGSSRNRIGTAAGRQRHDAADRPVGPRALSPDDGYRESQRSGSSLEKKCTTRCHAVIVTPASERRQSIRPHPRPVRERSLRIQVWSLGLFSALFHDPRPLFQGIGHERHHDQSADAEKKEGAVGTHSLVTLNACSVPAGGRGERGSDDAAWPTLRPNGAGR